MTRAVARFTPRAKQALDDIWLYVALEGSPHAATNVIEDIEAVCSSLLARFPEAGVPRPDLGFDVRMYTKHNYNIYYEPADNGVRVLHVIHGRRDQASAFSDDKA